MRTKLLQAVIESKPTNPIKPTPEEPYDDALVDTKEAARILNLAPATLATWRTRGGGPDYVKLGSRVAYARPTLRAWALARRRSNTSESC